MASRSTARKPKKGHRQAERMLAEAMYPLIEVTRSRHIKLPVKLMLWAKSAGRCEFGGCNKELWKSPVTQERVNIAEMAHIYAFSAAGARGNKGISKDNLNDFENLLLVCQECHTTIDKDKYGGRYSVSQLRKWKADHERRIAIVTGINPKRKSHVVLYGTNIGTHSSPLEFDHAAQALFPNLYPAEDRAIVLGTIDGVGGQRAPDFWQREAEHLTTRFQQRLKDRISSGGISHLSLFALASQPLLILLGTLLTDIPNFEVFQRHREPQTWAWPPRARTQPFKVIEPERFDGPPALVFAMSATVTRDRVTKVLGEMAAIWTVAIPKPHNDFTKSRKQLSEFRSLMRPLLDKIKAVHGQSTVLNIFPATSAALCVELGRIRTQMADMPWQVFDQVNELGGFVPTICIPNIPMCQSR